MQCPSCQVRVDPSQRFCPSCGFGLAGNEPRVQADPMLGQTLGGKYKVVRLLGEGGMGAVYECEQQLGTTKRKVAVKTLHPHLSLDANIKARFEREVGTVAELEHPNTIQVYDFGSHADGILYIAMEYLQGKSLANLLEREGALAPDRIERIVQQVCGSLEEAHERGIVHRDLKPDNVVLVERAGQKDFVKVLDFGIAKRSRESDSGEQKLTQQGMVLGTPPYMSPEQFSGRPVDIRSDIYSLGVMTYEMLTGRLPFHANTAWEWATQHMTQPPAPIESSAKGAGAPEAMRNAIRCALEKAPDARFQTVRAFAEALKGGAPRKSVELGREAAGRHKTELGSPIDLAAAFGSPLQGGERPYGSPRRSTPLGNMSFPTPAASPQPPERGDPRTKRSEGDGGRGVLLAAAGVIAAASVGAIIFAMRGGGPVSSRDVVFNQGSSAPVTSLTPSPATAAAAAEESAASKHVSGQAPPVAPSTPPAPTPAAPPSAAPNPSKYDGPECATARRLRALGHPKEAEAWAAACAARGGPP
jgi:eukaryotic-like serine/threonine-protein kinase